MDRIRAEKDTLCQEHMGAGAAQRGQGLKVEMEPAEYEAGVRTFQAVRSRKKPVDFEEQCLG